MSILSKIDRVITRHLNLKPFYIKPKEAVISFTFDDFPSSSVSVAGEILKKHNYTATYYCVGNFIGTTQDNIIQYTSGDIDRLLSEGHELGCHTETHIDCQSITSSDLKNNIKNNEEIIYKLSSQKPSSFSYPFGKVGLISKLIIGKVFPVARGISSGLNYGLSDLSQLKANKLYSEVTSISDVEDLILTAIKNKAWLVFYTHDVTENPSKYGCTPDFFEKVVDLVKCNNCKVLPIKHALAYIGFKQR